MKKIRTLLLLLAPFYLIACIVKSSAGESSELALHADQFGHQFRVIPAGKYILGASRHWRNRLHTAQLASFEIATTEVTNAQFSRFIAATGYVTDAERRGWGKSFEEGMIEWEWEETAGANWRFPNGPMRGGIAGLENHPVTQISYNDALAYCNWAHVRLPTADEWEVAARAGSTSLYPWGAEFPKDGPALANIWEGESHQKNSLHDGFQYTAPVKSYPPNHWGIYDVIGNVFEYVDDERALIFSRGKPTASMRGGSWWCSASSCSYFNLIDIGQMPRDGSLSNQGFRVAR